MSISQECVVTVRMDKETHAALKDFAWQNKQSVNTVVLDAIKKAIAERVEGGWAAVLQQQRSAVDTTV